MSYEYQTTIYDAYGNATSTHHHTIAAPAKPPAVPNPGYFSALRSGSPLPIGAWDRDIVDSSAGSGVVDASIQRGSKAYGAIFSGHIGDAQSEFASRHTDVTDWKRNVSIPESALHQKAISGAKNHAWDISTFAAEINKTATLVSGVSDRVYQRAQNILFRRGPGKVVKTMYDFASIWLEYRYGWRLLMYDIEAMEESLGRANEAADISLERYTAHHQESTTFSNVVGPTTTLLYPGATAAQAYSEKLYHNSTTVKWDVRYGAGVRSWAAANITVNPLLTIWEILPYSFLVDRIVDIGTAIGALTPTLGRNLVYVWRSSRLETTTTQQLSWSQPPGSYPSNYYDGTGNSGSTTGTHSVIEYHRAPATHSPWSLDINPRLDIPIGLDVAALMLLRDKKVRRSIGGRF